MIKKRFIDNFFITYRNFSVMKTAKICCNSGQKKNNLKATNYNLKRRIQSFPWRFEEIDKKTKSEKI